MAPLGADTVESMAEYQLRSYDIVPGKMSEFLRVFPAVAEARRHYGFDVAGAWVDEDQHRFVWILSFGGPGTFEEAATRYYESPEREALDPNPSDLIANVEARMVRSIPV